MENDNDNSTHTLPISPKFNNVAVSTYILKRKEHSTVATSFIEEPINKIIKLTSNQRSSHYDCRSKTSQSMLPYINTEISSSNQLIHNKEDFPIMNAIMISPSISINNNQLKLKSVFDRTDDDLLSSESKNKIENFERLMQKVKVRVKLMAHQRFAVGWWTKTEGTTREQRRRLSGAILADDMGLGKTIVAIASSLVGRYMDSSDGSSLYIHSQPLLTPTLIICPKSLIKQWQREIKDKTVLSDSEVHVFYDNGRSISADLIKRKTFVITTYDVLRSLFSQITSPCGKLLKDIGERGIMYDMQWDRIILDEAHKIKDATKKTNKCVTKLRGNRRWAITGTPYNNGVSDLAAICNFIGISPYLDQSWWKNADSNQIKEWRDMYLLRRTKEILNLPPLKNHEIVVQLNEKESKFYDNIALEAEANFQDFTTSSGTAKSQAFRELLVWLLRLRQCGCDPLLLLGRRATIVFSKQTYANKDKYFTNCGRCDSVLSSNKIKKKNYKQGKDFERLKCGHIVCVECAKSSTDCTICKFEVPITTPSLNNHSRNQNISVPQLIKSTAAGLSTKTQVLINHLQDQLKNKTSKIVIFSQWTSYLDLIENAIYNNIGVTYCRMDGDVHGINKRDEIIEKFVKNPNCRIFLTTLNAGGLGLNLICANEVILMDSWYNPFVEQQAIDRIYRYGQTQHVVVTRITVDTSVDIAVKRIQKGKIEDAKYCLQGVGLKKGAGLNEAEMRSVFAHLIEARKRRQTEKLAIQTDNKLNNRSIV